ncbi:TcpE family conjugal transfer membrane protein [Embleya sp. MST-111070]|uniref:TcpE family conjugal transfer membrane protein n=1 Tax=Embleya sp. MST-111070 TaxID=3398231 RepID=UPI003F74186A
MTASEEELVGRSYTRARKHPLVIGKLPGAGRLPGGPYTITQIVTMVVVFVVLVITRQLWARFGLLNVLVMVVVPWGLAWVLRYARLDGRDPARALRSLMTYASTPADGRLAGRPQRRARQQVLGAACSVRIRQDERPAGDPSREPAGATSGRGTHASSRPARPTTASPPRRDADVGDASVQVPAARTGLQGLLASLDER